MHAAPTFYCIELRTAQWQTMLDWYRSVLAAKCLVRVIDDGYAILNLGDVRLALIERPTTAPSSSRWSLAFEVNNLAQTEQALASVGVAAYRAAIDAEGVSSLECADPDGNRIRFFTWPAQSA